MPKVNCDSCGAKTEVPEMYLERRVRCPKCRSEFVASVKPKAVPKPPPSRPSLARGETVQPEAQLKAALVGVGRKYIGQGRTTTNRLLPTRIARISAMSILLAMVIGSVVALVVNHGADKSLFEQEKKSDQMSQQIDDQMTKQAADLRAKAAQLRAQEPSNDGADESTRKHKTVDELIAEDSLISNLIDMDDQFGQIRSGMYPRDIIDLWIVQGKMTASQAIHVQNFCEMIRTHQY